MTMTWLEVALFVSLFLTVGVLALGIGLMVKGGALNKKYSTHLMRLRVLFQGVALFLFALVLMQKGS